MKKKANHDIKTYMFQNDVTQIELANELNCSTSTIYRKLALELSKEEKEILKTVIKKIVEEREDSEKEATETKKRYVIIK